MIQAWWQRALDAIADRGRELLKLPAQPEGVPGLGALCHRLLANPGEASGIALAREILAQYAGLDSAQRLEFFELLAAEFNPEPAQLRRVIADYLDSPGPEQMMALVAQVEPPRQDLLRALNMAPGGTAALVRLRGDLLAALRSRPQLQVVDADLRHLLASWFNRGFLSLDRIDWQTPAAVLEKLIRYESVHAINGWEDLRRRVARDRSCFAFFHPAIPGEPLIFVEVGLVRGMPGEIQPLLDVEGPVLDPREADTAVFYSINNTQAGLRGISFGNFLIKQVLGELHRDYPHIRHFVTLSPLPRLCDTLRQCLEGRLPALPERVLDRLLEDLRGELCDRGADDTPARALIRRLDEGASAVPPEPVERLVIAYLSTRRDGGVVDPVASFHLANGARLERVNLAADRSARGTDNAWGVMVNYVYDEEQLEANHERFVSSGQVAVARPLARTLRLVEDARAAAAKDGA